MSENEGRSFDRPIEGLGALSRMRRPDTLPPAAIVDLAPAAPETVVEPPVAAPTPPAPSLKPETTPDDATRPSERRTAPRTPSEAPATRKTPQKAVQRSAEAESPKEQLGARVSRDVGRRARAAFRATGYLEGDESFSDFVERALLRETERRERKSNDGKPFPFAGDRLPAGRPLRS